VITRSYILLNMKEELFYLLLVNDTFSNQIICNFPGMYSYITSLKQNASKEHTEKCKERIWSFYESNELFKNQFISFYSNLKNRRVDGKVFEVKNTEEYTRLILRSKNENWIYDGISIVETHDKIKVYFY